MTVAELMAKLGEYPADMRVVVDGYEAGVDEIVELAETAIQVGVNADCGLYMGLHGVVYKSPSGKFAEGFDEFALLLKGGRPT